MSRSAWVDAFKGLCITLVVFGHVVGGLGVAGIVQPNSVLTGVRTWVYLFHMPAFFFASGLFAARAVKRPFVDFLGSRAATLIYPYCLWTGIIVLSQWALARLANNAPDFAKAAHFLYEPYGYGLWFLYALLLISLIYQLAARSKLPAALLVACALALYAAATLNLFRFWPILNTALTYFIYFALGAAFAQYASALFDAPANPRLVGLSALALGAMTLLGLGVAGLGWATPLACALLGIVGLVGLAKALVALRIDRFWSYAGAHSLEIYLGHILLATLPRPLLKAAGVTQPWLYVLCGVATGLFGSLGLAGLCRALKFPYLYRWPLTKPLAIATPRLAVR